MVNLGSILRFFKILYQKNFTIFALTISSNADNDVELKRKQYYSFDFIGS